jgi:hypothetical protein
MKANAKTENALKNGLETVRRTVAGLPESVEIFYLCPRCMEPADEPLPCPRCGGQRVTCRPGTANDPVRKPLTTATGELRSRAPVWWLQAVGALVN